MIWLMLVAQDQIVLKIILIRGEQVVIRGADLAILYGTGET